MILYRLLEYDSVRTSTLLAVEQSAPLIEPAVLAMSMEPVQQAQVCWI